jgi:hypothetical protein
MLEPNLSPGTNAPGLDLRQKGGRNEERKIKNERMKETNKQTEKEERDNLVLTPASAFKRFGWF